MIRVVIQKLSNEATTSMIIHFLLIFIPQIQALEPMKFMHQANLNKDTDFLINWSPNDEGFTMEMSAQTLGYLGVGFSPNGGMKGSDIFIGWVTDDGQALGKDTFADGKSAPKLDKSQDYEVLGGMRNATHTSIRFRRNWDTCDDDDDMKLGSGTVRIIWAIGSRAPDNGWQYHGAERGVRSIHLKEPAKPKMPQGDDVKIWELRAHNQILPNNEDTYYGCQVFKVPWLTKKHHIIAVITTNNFTLAYFLPTAPGVIIVGLES